MRYKPPHTHRHHTVSTACCLFNPSRVLSASMSSMIIIKPRTHACMLSTENRECTFYTAVVAVPLGATPPFFLRPELGASLSGARSELVAFPTSRLNATRYIPGLRANHWEHKLIPPSVHSSLDTVHILILKDQPWPSLLHPHAASTTHRTIPAAVGMIGTLLQLNLYVAGECGAGVGAVVEGPFRQRCVAHERADHAASGI